MFECVLVLLRVSAVSDTVHERAGQHSGSHSALLPPQHIDEIEILFYTEGDDMNLKCFHFAF